MELTEPRRPEGPIRTAADKGTGESTYGYTLEQWAFMDDMERLKIILSGKVRNMVRKVCDQ